MRSANLTVKMIAVCILALSCVSCGPRMNIQPSVQPFEKQMPVMPSKSTPTTGSFKIIAKQQAKLTSNPLPKTKTNLRNGEIYYGYYCLMCHGAKGDGNGPVGESYVPKPADLSSPNLARLNDGQLYWKMLYGVGHAPVMEQTVLLEHRWPLVMYVRTFAKPKNVNP
ncbi:MAG: cytochrome C [Armatimonadota bacterium]|nr:cytochrome C [Armatimonadota bacterium]